ncbi:hypothetical protein E4T39_01537 [Aureobasidium subglaciale]|nr:hypothetical protein E4T39_01537 [Aureobasidium subglaciale]
MDDPRSPSSREAGFRRSLLNYEEISAQMSEQRSQDVSLQLRNDSGYRTLTPEPAAFLADPNSPHLAPSPCLHPNITTRAGARSRNHRRFSDLFALSHRGRQTPTFGDDTRPKISRPIVNQGEIDVPHNGPYIYNHPSRPRLDVEIPRSSFSDLWGQRYGIIGDEGYNVDGPRNTQSMDFGRLVGSEVVRNHATRRNGVSLGGIADWNVDGMYFGTPVSDNGATDAFEHNERSENEEHDQEHNVGVDASYISPILRSLDSVASSTSASLPSLSNLPPLPPSTLVLEQERIRTPSPIDRDLSERWLRHPLRQNPPNQPLPRAPPSSPISFPSSPTPHHWTSQTRGYLMDFRPSCGVIIAGMGDIALMQPFTVNDPAMGIGDVMTAMRESLENEGEESSDDEDYGVYEDPPIAPTPMIARRFSEMGASTHQRENSGNTQRRESGSRDREDSGFRSFCCGLFSRRHRHRDSNSSNSSYTAQARTPTPAGIRPSTSAPVAHESIAEESDEESLNDQENIPPRVIQPALQHGDQGTSIPVPPRFVQPSNIHRDRSIGIPPRVVQPSSESNNQVDRTTTEDDQGIQPLIDEHNEHNDQGSGIGETDQADGVGRRHSVRRSWVTVSRWLD